MTQFYSTSTSLASIPNSDNEELAGLLRPVYNAIEALQIAIDAYTQPIAQDSSVWSVISPIQTILSSNLNRCYRQAAVAISAGQLVGIDAAGQIVLADANPLIACRGFATAAIAAGAWGEFITWGGCINYGAGLTMGATYYLSDTAGNISATPGTNVQMIGWALTAGILVFQPQLV